MPDWMQVGFFPLKCIPDKIRSTVKNHIKIERFWCNRRTETCEMENPVFCKTAKPVFSVNRKDYDERIGEKYMLYLFIASVELSCKLPLSYSGLWI